MENLKEIQQVFSAKLVEASTFLRGMRIHEDHVAFIGNLDEKWRALVQHLLNAGVKVRLWEPNQRRNEERYPSALTLSFPSNLILQADFSWRTCHHGGYTSRCPQTGPCNFGGYQRLLINRGVIDRRCLQLEINVS